MIYLSLCILLGVYECGQWSKKSEADTPAPTNIQSLKSKYDEVLDEAKKKADPTDGWIEKSECDGMLWAGKYLCGGGSPKLEAAEYPNEPGKFNRRPSPYCGEEFGNSKTTWSRDMGMGLMSGAWCSKNREILERHASYGTKKNSMMGEPFADGRAVYTPSIIGILYQVIYSLGGADTTARHTPSIFSSGLDDYQAHLQMIDIWLRGETARREIDLSLDISQTMYERVKEHSDREPTCPFYQYMRGIYDGSLETVTSLLLESDKPKCQYVRGSDGVFTSEWLFVAKLTLKKFGAVE